MIWGLIISLVLTVVVVLLATNAKSNKKPGVLSWGVAVVCFLVLWFTAGRMVENIRNYSAAKQMIANASAGLGTLAEDELSAEVYGLISGLGVTDAIVSGAGEAVLHFCSVRIWTYLVVSLVVALVMYFGFTLFMEAKPGSGSYRSGDEGYSTRGAYEDF